MFKPIPSPGKQVWNVMYQAVNTYDLTCRENLAHRSKFGCRTRFSRLKWTKICGLSLLKERKLSKSLACDY